MNFIPATDYISDHISPLTMVTGQGAPDYKQMKIEFGAYAQVFEENQTTNTQDTRAIGCIALASYPDENGAFPFMNLNTGQVIWRRQFTEIPITDLVINRVHHLADADKQRNIVGGSPLIEWRPGVLIEDTSDDASVEYPLIAYDNIPALPPPLDTPPIPASENVTSENVPLLQDDATTLHLPTPDLTNDDDNITIMTTPLDASSTHNDTISEHQRSDDERSVAASISSHLDHPLAQRSEDDDVSVDPHNDKKSVTASISSHLDHPPAQRSEDDDVSVDPHDDRPTTERTKSLLHTNDEPMNESVEATNLTIDNDANRKSNTKPYNTRNKRLNYGYRFANQMNKSKDNKSYETQFVQHHTSSELTPMKNIRNTKVYTDYTINDVEHAVDKLITEEDSKDALNFIVHYMLTQMHNMDDPEIFKQMGAKKGIN